MKTLIVGDIHGCYLEFQELLARSGIAKSDEIIALGDIVDRGPETPLAMYLHLARRGELDHARAKKALRRPDQALELAKQVGLR
jgi:predicted phosphodiesterase